MAWIAVDKVNIAGSAAVCLYRDKPTRWINCWLSECDFTLIGESRMVTLIGRKLTWDDEPVEVDVDFDDEARGIDWEELQEAIIHTINSYGIKRFLSKKVDAWYIKSCVANMLAELKKEEE